MLPPSSQWISIHAPRTGSDVCDSVLNSVDSLFQSTLPARGATFGILRCVADLKSFQSTLPARGATAGAGIFQPARIFQSTLPARGATARDAGLDTGIIISIHAPRTGSDDEEKLLLLELLHFNPRSPHGERHHRRADCPIRFDFNPRSPHGERRCRIPGIPCRALFQSTLPARGATSGEISCIDLYRGFQSTLPARGATRGQQSAGLLVHYFNPRSPHGERPLQCFRLGQGRHFNPRSPHGERRFSRFLPRFAVIISIHAPRTGSDHPALRRASESLPISIHAPRTGSDDGSRRHFEKRGNFNPRSPHGERRADVKLTLKQCSFQSTLPARGATDRVELKDRAFLFQSTLPARGATLELLKTAVYQSFQSTLPARGATLIRWVCCRGFFHFNPRSPHGERLRRVRLPCAGRAYFNPRSPHGERRCWKGTPENRNYFNPRSPHGERRIC